MRVNKPTKAQYRGWATAMLNRRPHELIIPNGYHQRGLVFSRVANRVKQVVRFNVVVRPRYAADKAQLVLDADVSVPDADAMFNDSLAAAGIEPQPYVISVAEDSLKQSPRELWLFGDEAEAFLLEPSVTAALSTEIIPFLDERSTIGNLADLCYQETKQTVDEHGPAADFRAIYVAALYAIIDRRESAREILAAGYPVGSRARETYKAVFDFYDHRS